MFLDAKHTGNPSRVRELVHLVDRTYSAWSPAWYHAGVKLSLEYQLSFEDGVGGIFERLAAQSWRSQCQQKSGSMGESTNAMGWQSFVDGDDNWVQVDMLRRYSNVARLYSAGPLPDLTSAGNEEI
ncbi:hypothetical protein ARMGADRAFT_1036319 [Armillaria gallica]|uniref:Uncharacterized protein n=1 Tax=Armillaria gallica TaxID=47427 RepID=A0A2H3CVU3_ARMGA|nr:hypothetical protein ARMGADRAFT_1036319 [Armillaria gallica]